MEISALKEAASLQRSVQNAVLKREWRDFERFIKELNEVSLRLQVLETERLALFRDIGDSGDKNGSLWFYRFACGLPREEREALTALYRTLKMECARLRFSAKAWTEYLQEIKEINDGLLDAVFPERKAKLYGRSGAVKSAGIRSAVLDKKF